MRFSLMLASIAVAMFSFVAQPAFADPGLQTTGVMHFMDSDWDTIGACYVAGSDSAYLELKDEDADSHVLLRDSVLVLLKSEFGDGEVIYLRETGLSTGVFHAAIAFDLQANKFMSWLKQKYPDGLGSGKEADKLMASELAVWQNSAKKQALATNDGKLQVAAGNLLTAIYLDPLNDWGVQETITKQTIYGGWEGYVSGVWKASGNPYIVVGDLTIGQGYSLTMEAGVQVRFMHDVSLQVNGGASLIIRGSETDSVHLTSFKDVPADSVFWTGIYIASGYSDQHGRLSINHAVISKASQAISCNSYDTLELLSSHITQCGSDDWYGNPALYCSGPIRLIGCLVDNCSKDGIDISGPYAEIRGTTVSGNAGTGISISRSNVAFEDVTVTDNTYGGIIVYNYYSSSYVDFRIYHSQLHDNGDFDLSNNSREEVDARFNRWGAATTADINAGGNPKNLAKIWDHFDDSYYGYVRYGGCDGCPVPGSDGKLAFANTYGDTIGQYYPPGTDSIYLVLTDLDLNANPFQLDHIDISLSSRSGDEETVSLRETDVNTGVFRCAIPVDLQAPIFLNWVTQKYPGGFDSMSPDEVNALIRDELNQWTTQTKKARIAPGDGQLQIAPGDQITAIYYDALNEWGSPATITATAIYGGWSGFVSGVWTKENNPYIVVGDITVGSGYSLTMQPGVQVRFERNASLIVQYGGKLRVRGTEGDSVYLTSDELFPSDSEFWGGVRSSGYYPEGTELEISYAVIANAVAGITHDGDDMLNLSHSHITNCGRRQDYYSSQAVYTNGPFAISDCLIDSSRGIGLILAHSGKISGTEVSGGGDWGIRVGSPGIEIERSKVINNYLEGIVCYSSDPGNPLVVHHSHLYGNGGYDFANYGQSDIDAKYNWWGETTTQEMKNGDNPKNIAKIYDRFDYWYNGIVKYGGWMNFPYVSGDADGSGDINIADVVWLIGYLFSAGPAPAPVGAGDTNCDGRVNIADVVCLINYVFGGGQMPGVNCE